MRNKFLAAFKIVLFLLIATTLMTGCQRGEDGPPGPKGHTGSVGAKGATGVQGLDGEPLVKGGNITGTITGQRADGTALNETFKLEYNFSSSPAAVTRNGDLHYITFHRFDSLQNGHLNVTFQTDASFKNSQFTYGYFSFPKAAENNQYALCSGFLNYNNNKSSYLPASVTGSISNVSYNAATGLLTGQFSWQVDNAQYYDSGTVNGNYYYVYYVNSSTSGKPVQLTGTFSILTKLRSYRVGSPNKVKLTSQSY